MIVMGTPSPLFIIPIFYAYVESRYRCFSFSRSTEIDANLLLPLRGRFGF